MIRPPLALTISTGSAEETLAAGEALAIEIRPGDVIALVGELGTGKTVLVKGLARGLGVESEDAVTSPSYVILNEYRGRLDIYHFDFYRLDKPRDIEGLGYEEYFEGGGVTVAEWADKFAFAFGPGTLWIELSRTGDETRDASFFPGLGLSGRWPAMEKALLQFRPGKLDGQG